RLSCCSLQAHIVGCVLNRHSNPGADVDAGRLVWPIAAPAEDGPVHAAADEDRLIGALQRVITLFGLAVIADDRPGEGCPAVDNLTLEDGDDLVVSRTAVVVHRDLSSSGW